MIVTLFLATPHKVHGWLHLQVVSPLNVADIGYWILSFISIENERMGTGFRITFHFGPLVMGRSIRKTTKEQKDPGRCKLL